MTTINTFGDGSDGAYTTGNIVRGATHNFTTFDLDSEIDIDGGTGLTIIYVQGDLVLGASAVINAIKQTIGAQPGDITIFGGKFNANKNADGDTGDGGKGGDGQSFGGGYEGGIGGAGGTDSVVAVDGTDGTDRPGKIGGDGGLGGGLNGGGGGGGGSANDAFVGENGGNGASGIVTTIEEQPTILFIVGGDITIDIAATINGDGVTGVTGNAGSAGATGSGGNGGGGGGSGGGGGTSGLKILFYYAGSYSNAGTLAAAVGVGGTGGAGGLGGTIGVTGDTGTLDGIITKISDVIIKEIFALQATAVAEIDFEGGIVATERGFVYSTITAPTTADTKQVVAGAGEMEAAVTGFLEDTVYYLRPFATNSVETIYGTEISFKTHKSFIPSIIIGN